MTIDLGLSKAGQIDRCQMLAGSGGYQSTASTAASPPMMIMAR